jgi:hypothetical protein
MCLYTRNSFYSLYNVGIAAYRFPATVLGHRWKPIDLLDPVRVEMVRRVIGRNRSIRSVTRTTSSPRFQVSMSFRGNTRNGCGGIVTLLARPMVEIARQNRACGLSCGMSSTSSGGRDCNRERLQIDIICSLAFQLTSGCGVRWRRGIFGQRFR